MRCCIVKTVSFYLNSPCMRYFTIPVTEHNIYRYTLIHEGNAGRGSILWSVVARATLTAKPAHLHVASSPGSLEPGDEANLHVHTASTCNVECGVLYCGPRLPVLRKMSG